VFLGKQTVSGGLEAIVSSECVWDSGRVQKL
jgi:hypothetical protein